MPRLEGIIFDLDGTLVDSKRDIAQSIVHVVKTKREIAVREEAVYPYIGGSLRQTLRELGGHPSEEVLDEMVEDYKRHYFSRCDLLSRPFPGVIETLDKLSNYRKAVATAKLAFMAEEVLRRHGLIRYFDAVVGSDSMPLKPAPDVIIAATEAMGANPKNTLVVGDTEKDIFAAKSAGALTCAVTYGIRSKRELAECAADFMIDSFSDIIEKIRAIEALF